MKICVIGAGVFGIAAVRELVRVVPGACIRWISEDLAAGGLWSASAKRTRTYNSLYMNTSVSRSVFSGTSINVDGAIQFVHHSVYASYLARVADNIMGADCEWACRVKAVELLESGKWRVVSESSEVEQSEEFDAVVDATGRNEEPLFPDVQLSGERTYRYLHSADYWDATPYSGESVLIVGNGASAVDLACDLVQVASHVGISARTPKWHIPKTLFGRPVDQSGGGRWQRSPLVGGLTSLVSEIIVRTAIGSYRSYGLELPKARLADSVPVLSDHFLSHLRHGRLQVYPMVTAMEADSVRFADDVSEKFDTVIAATGFCDQSAHLPETVRAVLSDGRLGVAFQIPEFPGLHLMNRFRCADAAVRCAEVQATAVVRELVSQGRSTRRHKKRDLPHRITAEALREIYNL